MTCRPNRPVQRENANMANAQPISLGGIQFAMKADALAYFKAMLNRYRPGDQVAEQDQPMLEAALANHSDAIIKIGVGVASFEVREADYGTQCFWVRRLDGSLERFSYKSCV